MTKQQLELVAQEISNSATPQKELQSRRMQLSIEDHTNLKVRIEQIKFQRIKDLENIQKHAEKQSERIEKQDAKIEQLAKREGKVDVVAITVAQIQ